MRLRALFCNTVLVCLFSIECQYIPGGGVDPCRQSCQNIRQHFNTFQRSQPFVDRMFNSCMQHCLPVHNRALDINTSRPVTVAPTMSECGVNQILTPKIIGGRDASECEFPWMVAIKIGGRICGGTILDGRNILSAAHCFYDGWRRTQPQDVMVEVGSSYLKNLTPHRVASINVHHMYQSSSTNLDYDVAVIKLANDLTPGRCVVPICLPSENEYPTGDCTATGWGLSGEPFNGVLERQLSPDLLQKVRLPIIDNNRCSKNYIDIRINDLKLCAGDFQRGRIDSCIGDSGGPLICKESTRYSTRYVQHGIVSGGRSCGKAGLPGVYTKVANREILNFIQKALKQR